MWVLLGAVAASAIATATFVIVADRNISSNQATISALVKTQAAQQLRLCHATRAAYEDENLHVRTPLKNLLLTAATLRTQTAVIWNALAQESVPTRPAKLDQLLHAAAVQNISAAALWRSYAVHVTLIPHIVCDGEDATPMPTATYINPVNPKP